MTLPDHTQPLKTLPRSCSEISIVKFTPPPRSVEHFSLTDQLALPSFTARVRLSEMAIDEDANTTTRLLTLLNVSATKANKRKRTFEESKPSEKLNKKRTVQIAAPTETLNEPLQTAGEDAPVETEQEEGVPGGEEADDPSACASSSCVRSFLTDPTVS